jgi:hypothetical protein
VFQSIFIARPKGDGALLTEKIQETMDGIAMSGGEIITTLPITKAGTTDGVIVVFDVD